MNKKEAYGPAMARYKSRSSDAFWVVRLRGDGELTCNCRGYRFHRHCWHRDAVMAKMDRPQPEVQTVTVAA
jgi:hypothetical protein